MIEKEIKVKIQYNPNDGRFSIIFADRLEVYARNFWGGIAIVEERVKNLFLELVKEGEKD